MKKILLIPYSPENKYQDLLAESLERNGVEVIKGDIGEQHPLFTLGGRIPDFFPIISFVYDHNDIDAVHIIWTHLFFIMSNKSEWYLTSALFTVIKSIAFLINVLLTKMLGIQIVWTVHNKCNHDRDHVYIDIFTSRILVRLCDNITVECEKAKRKIVDLFWIRNEDLVTVIPEGNYIPAYPNDTTKTQAKSHLNICDTDFLFLYFGLIREYKGVPKLISQFLDTSLHEDASLYIAGKPINKHLEQSIMDMCAEEPDIFTALEYIPDNEIQYYMNAADVIVLPYTDILTSGSILLAMSFGKPVVAPDLGCIPTILPDQGGFIYNSEKDTNLSSALMMAKESDELEVMGERNLEKARQLSWDHIATRTIDLY